MLGDTPTIAVTTGFTDYGDYLGVALSRPLVAVGSAPVLLPYLDEPDARGAALDAADGLLLGFGRDLEPARYGAEPHPAMTAMSPLRDAFELALTVEALDRDLPILGICRGMQVLNVALGGTLYRDRSEYPAAARGHPGGDWALWDRVCDAALGLGPPVAHPSHAITIAPGSRLHAAMGEHATVNSYHHQAIDRLGRDVEAVACSGDGIVEAVELPDREFVLGVQWELQEAWREDPGGRAVFEGFVSAARRRASARAHRRRPAEHDAPQAGAAR